MAGQNRSPSRPYPSTDPQNGSGGGSVLSTGLTDLERAVLDLEGKWWRYAGAKEDAIRGLGHTPTRHAQILNRLLDDPAAVAYASVLVNRLRRRVR